MRPKSFSRLSLVLLLAAAFPGSGRAAGDAAGWAEGALTMEPVSSFLTLDSGWTSRDRLSGALPAPSLLPAAPRGKPENQALRRQQDEALNVQDQSRDAVLPWPGILWHRPMWQEQEELLPSPSGGGEMTVAPEPARAEKVESAFSSISPEGALGEWSRAIGKSTSAAADLESGSGNRRELDFYYNPGNDRSAASGGASRWTYGTSVSQTTGSTHRFAGGFRDLVATNPVQVHPAPLLVGPETNALPAGQTLYISELNGIISSATGAGGTVSTYKTINTNNALFGIGAFGGSLYVVDQNANVIDRVVLSTGTVSTFASLGSTNNRPTALAIDGSGNIYVTLSTTGGINKITPGGVISLFATLPAGSNPQGLGFAPNGNLYSANAGLKTISQITPAGVVSTFATFSGGSYPTNLLFGGLAVDKNGNLYVVDQETTANALGNVYKVTPGGSIGFFASVGANSQPIGLAFDANGILYTANVSSISQITPAGVVSTFANDGNGPAYLVVVPEPATCLGGMLLLGTAAVLTLRRSATSRRRRLPPSF